MKQLNQLKQPCECETKTDVVWPPFSFLFLLSFFTVFTFQLLCVFLLDKGDYPENLHVVFCPNKYKQQKSKLAVF